MEIAVTTPTGHVGSRVTRLLLQAGVRPRLLLRDAGRLDDTTRELADVREGDLADPDYVRAATAGADVLFLVAPEDLTADDPAAPMRALGRSAAAAVRANGIGHVVFQSSVGAELRNGAGIVDALGDIEASLDATGAAVLHLRCGYFFTNLLLDAPGIAAGELVTAADPAAPAPWVDPRDIGDVAAARLLAAGWSGRVVQAVHGPADLTWHEVAEVLTGVLGRPVAVRRISDEEARAGMIAAGFPAGAADAVTAMTRGLRDGFVPEQPRTALTTTPTTLAAWAYANLR
ncbi:NmrA family NAD(P)-binding protein [Spirilliplanes yamanashiensis]|nr:NAD(P)H-binding protein [Spirilliplanes yamanashiensis]MDP9819351.1 uncharacterized protein YbjT (DUF2867 family) [Spirilliplanes yamanashiensis]